jgi:hypothetical protein
MSLDQHSPDFHNGGSQNELLQHPEVTNGRHALVTCQGPLVLLSPSYPVERERILNVGISIQAAGFAIGSNSHARDSARKLQVCRWVMAVFELHVSPSRFCSSCGVVVEVDVDWHAEATASPCRRWKQEGRSEDIFTRTYRISCSCSCSLASQLLSLRKASGELRCWQSSWLFCLNLLFHKHVLHESHLTWAQGAPRRCMSYVMLMFEAQLCCETPEGEERQVKSESGGSERTP